MSNVVYGPEEYVAIDGDRVRVPPQQPLDDGPMPRFDATDRARITRLVAIRDAEADRTLEGLGALDNAARVRKRQARLLATATARFGARGERFLEALDAPLERDDDGRVCFWEAVDTLFCAPLRHVRDREAQALVRALLLRFPERVWLPLVAEAVWPEPRPKRHQAVAWLLRDWLWSERGDLRHLETGSAKPSSEDDLPAAVRGAMGMAFGDRRVQAMTVRAFLSARGDGAVARGQASEDCRLHEIDTILARGAVPSAGPGNRALTPGDIGAAKLQAYLAIMRKVAPGMPEGGFLLHALTRKNGSIAGATLDKLPARVVWPYLASHFDILDRALGLAEPFYFEPKMEKRRAVALLRLLPKAPARYERVLREAAGSRTRTLREDARALLDGQ